MDLYEKNIPPYEVSILDIQQLEMWFTHFLNQPSYVNRNIVVKFSCPLVWKETLKDITREQIANGFINFTRLVKFVIENQVLMIPISPSVFRKLCCEELNYETCKSAY